MTGHVIARKHDEAIQSRAKWLTRCSSKAYRLYWIATTFGLAMTEHVMARRHDEAIQSGAQ
jgi:hypothetical protein